jgi:methyl-accepting chemotaxis protein
MKWSVKLLQRLKFKYKLLLIIATAMSGLVILSAVSLHSYRDSLLQEKKQQLKHVVETAYGVVDFYHRLSRDGGMSEDAARQASLAAVRNLRYEGKEYFWINDMRPALVMHPYKPELEGKDQSDYRDRNGKRLFIEFVETVKNGGSGYVFYSWPKPDSDEVADKLSFVMKFEPWGWIVGSGVYLDDVDAAFLRGVRLLVLGAVAIAGIVLLVAWAVAASITKPLEEVTAASERMADGDLTVALRQEGADEFAGLSRDLNGMICSINGMIDTVRSSANTIITSVDVLTTRAESAASGARNQSGQAQQIATAAEEMSQTITDIARNTAAASETSSIAMQAAEQGLKVADVANDAVHRVYTSTINLATMVEKLNNRVAEVSGIATVIKGIADQTNLLALNAAIEAARAGEQGRGFAVVADEVRKLAERTIKATAEITGKIDSIRTESEETARTMESSSGEVIASTGHIKAVRESLTAIVGSVQKARDQITQIATAVDEQSATAEEVASNIEKTAGIAREMETMSDDVIHEVHRLSDIVEELRNSAEKYRTRDGEKLILDNSKTDHILFMKKISAHLKGGARLEASKLPDHHTCRFGKWYDGEGRKQCGELPSYKAIEGPHERIHALAREAVSAHSSGDAGRAREVYAEMRQHSAQIGAHLDGIKRESKVSA